LRVGAYLRTGGYVVAATAAAWSARALVALPDLVAIYLLVIMLVAVRHGRGPAMLASAMSVVAYDVFFIDPLYTLSVADPRHLLTFGIMFTVGIVLSHLVERVREKEQEARTATLRARTEEIRSSLLSAVSHDLRTPLAAIKGAGGALRDQPLDEERRHELLGTVCDEADRLERLVVNLLDMTRLESGAIDVKSELVPVEELVGGALSRLEGRLATRPLRTDVPADLPLLSVDPVLAEHALVNLVENALKHTPAGSEISIEARRGGPCVELTVADRGPGLPSSVEPLFDKFTRAAPPGVEGAGLGLAIARGIARAHGGELTGDNRPGGGARFVLALPGKELA
jgi:K+-sensing histidine kinase KdpD